MHSKGWFPIAVLAAVMVFAGAGARAADDCGDRPYCLGEVVDESVFAKWDISVHPDGSGLPAGQGTSKDGKQVFDDQCSACHGEMGIGVKVDDEREPFPSLAGNKPPLTSTTKQPAITVGSYWPYATTVFDYVRRAMPFGEPQSLTTEELYSVVAYTLELNGLVEPGAVMDKDALLAVKMPNAGNFTCDARPDTRNPRCMVNCRIPGDEDFAFYVTSQDVAPVSPLDCMLRDAP